MQRANEDDLILVAMQRGWYAVCKGHELKRKPFLMLCYPANHPAGRLIRKNLSLLHRKVKKTNLNCIHSCDVGHINKCVSASVDRMAKRGNTLDGLVY